MKIIWPDAVTAVAASSEEDTYEAENTLNDWPVAVWKATSTASQTFTVTVAQPDAVHLGYTNFGGTLAYAAKNGGGSTVESGNLTASGAAGAYHYWYEPTDPSDIASVVFAFPIASEAVTVGVVRAGTLTEFQNPQYGMGEGLLDYSVEAELNNGGLYTISRTVGDLISGQVMTIRLASGKDPLVTLARSIRASVFSVMLIDNPAEIILARFDGRPEASRDLPGRNVVQFALKEAI